jgi:hypothetical protein
MLSLLLGIYTGWVRIGWQMPIGTLPIGHHGVIMTGSFLGTLICLERAVVMKAKWPMILPLIMVASLPVLLFENINLAYQLLILGSFGYLIISIQFVAKFKNISDYLLLIGALFQLCANVVLYITHSYPMAFAGWMLFLVFTIVGERLNLTRFLPTTKSDRIELYLWLFFLVLSTAFYHFGSAILVGLCFMGLAQWLLRNDIAVINSRNIGSYKFLGYSLIAGYLWLIITGVISFQKQGNPFLYDALLHSFFIGFAFNMIMAHAPIIFPGIIKINVKPHHSILFVWLGLLNISLLLRIIGDFTQNGILRKAGGIINGISILAYLLSVAYLIFKQKQPQYHGQSI